MNSSSDQTMLGSLLLGCLLAVLSVATALPPSNLIHGWDCISCDTNSMLAGNFGSFNPEFRMDDPWWIETIAKSYHTVALNAFLGSRDYNGTGVSGQVHSSAAWLSSRGYWSAI